MIGGKIKEKNFQFDTLLAPTAPTLLSTSLKLLLALVV